MNAATLLGTEWAKNCQNTYIRPVPVRPLAVAKILPGRALAERHNALQDPFFPPRGWDRVRRFGLVLAGAHRCSWVCVASVDCSRRGCNVSILTFRKFIRLGLHSSRAWILISNGFERVENAKEIP